MLAIVVMMVFGGSIPGLGATIAIGAIGLILLGTVAVTDRRMALLAQPLPFRLGLAGIALLPLIQIIPLPPSLWQALPGQALRIRTLSLAGLADTWQPLSVTPLFTAQAAVIAIVFVALVRLLLVLSVIEIRRVAWLILALIGVNIAIGLVQVASGGQVLRFYSAADHGALLGFYTNKNHAAMVLAASLPIAAYVLGSREKTQGTRTWVALIAGVVLVALVTTNSRAGIVLGVAAILLLGSLYVRAIKPIHAVVIVAAGIGILLLVSSTAAFEQVFNRFDAVDEDLRWQFLWTSRPLIERYWLWGSGIGSFSTLYAVGENLAWVKPTFVNQLHNEYPQLLLETGIPGALVFASVIAGLIWRGILVCKDGTAAKRLPVFFGAIIIALIAVHSGVDYPLRRPAVLPILALAIILVIRGDLNASTGVARRRQRN